MLFQILIKTVYKAIGNSLCADELKNVEILIKNIAKKEHVLTTKTIDGRH